MKYSAGKLIVAPTRVPSGLRGEIERDRGQADAHAHAPHGARMRHTPPRHQERDRGQPQRDAQEGDRHEEAKVDAHLLRALPEADRCEARQRDLEGHHDLKHYEQHHHCARQGRVCVRACVRACVPACARVCACVHVCACAYVHGCSSPTSMATTMHWPLGGGLTAGSAASPRLGSAQRIAHCYGSMGTESDSSESWAEGWFAGATR